jgi:hypothetical protein
VFSLVVAARALRPHPDHGDDDGDDEQQYGDTHRVIPAAAL